MSGFVISIRRIVEKIRDFFAGGVYYVNGPDTLPEPLSAKDEAEMLQRLSAGDEKARDKLIVHNLRLVVYIARKFDAASAGIEDLVSIGTIGLIKAVNTYNSDKNIKLATYASRCIENEILMYLRKTNPIKTEVSIDSPLKTDADGNDLLLGDVMGSDGDEINCSIEMRDEYAAVGRLIDALPPRERTIMRLRFGFVDGHEHTQKQVADSLGISQSYISRLEKKILLRLKNELETADK